MDVAGEGREDPRVLWPLLGLFWIGNVAATMVQVYTSLRSAGFSPGFVDLLGWVLPGYVVWLAGVPLIVNVLVRRFRFEEGRWRVSVPVHLLASLVITAAILVVDTRATVWRLADLDFGDTLVGMARSWTLWHVFTYWFFLALLLAVRHYMTAAARTLRATQLEAALANARLAMLRMQLRPHFLFNALNSISSLVADDPRAAKKMIARLGELLRAALVDVDGDDWTLRQELELVERYTDLERVRFGGRLDVEVTCDADTLDARVPILLLQPLVENAVLHGIQPALNGGTVRLAARRLNGELHVEVCDDGVGLPAAGADRRRSRVGLSNTRERLERCFPGRQSFTITRDEPAGTRVHIRMPWSTAPRADEAHAITH